MYCRCLSHRLCSQQDTERVSGEAAVRSESRDEQQRRGLRTTRAVQDRHDAQAGRVMIASEHGLMIEITTAGAVVILRR